MFNKLKNYIEYHKIITLFILVIVYLLSPVAIAVNENEIDTSKNYMIVRICGPTDCDLHVEYDSQKRSIGNIKFNHRFAIAMLNYTGFQGDLAGALNRYVLYTDENVVDDGVLIMDSIFVKLHPIYPIERDLTILPKSKRFIFRYEQYVWW